VHVSACDKATGKEQKIRIESSSGLNDAEIDRMVREAEQHAAEDEAKKERVETRNKAESMIHSARKSMGELGDKISDEQRSSIESKITALETALNGEDYDAMASGMEELEKELHTVAEQAYQAASGGAAPGGPEAAGAGAAGEQGSDDDDVIDAEFEETN